MTQPNDSHPPAEDPTPEALSQETPPPAEVSPLQEEENVLQSNYRVRQEAYQGPLDKLLELVRDKDIDLFQVSLASIAEDFLQYVLAEEKPDLNEMGSLLVIASQLLVLKSRQLLPTETEEEEEEPVDEEALLLKRLKDYETFKEAAGLLRQAEEERRRLYIRETSPPSVGKREAIDIYEVSIFDLATAFQKVMEEIGDESAPIIQGEEYTIDEKMAELQLLLKDTGELCLTLYLRSMHSRIEVIVTFLALLELMRLLRLRARQESSFGDIWIYRESELTRDEEGDLEVAVASDREGYVGDVHEDEEDEDDDRTSNREPEEDGIPEQSNGMTEDENDS